MDKNMPKAEGCGGPYMDKVFQELKGGVEQLISLVTSLHSELKSLWMIAPVFAAVNLSSLINEIVQSDAVSFAARGLRVDNDIDADLLAVRADEKLLRQVFVNLFRNAADAMAPGTGVLNMRAGAHARSVWLEIADTGGGIPPGLDVFQPFITSKPGSLGLGLAITRHIVETHGGTINYKSQPGKGTTFRLSLPRLVEIKKIPVLRVPGEDKRSHRILGHLSRAAER
jgi:signal transduction histidine kinase